MMSDNITDNTTAILGHSLKDIKRGDIVLETDIDVMLAKPRIHDEKYGNKEWWQVEVPIFGEVHDFAMAAIKGMVRVTEEQFLAAVSNRSCVKIEEPTRYFKHYVCDGVKFASNIYFDYWVNDDVYKEVLESEDGK